MDPIQLVALVVGAAAVLSVLWDGFETIVVPKTVDRPHRLTSLFYRIVWKVWHALAVRLPEGTWRQAALVSFGPLSLIALFATWAVLLVCGFGLIMFSLGGLGPDMTIGGYIFKSGTTFFTLGYADLTTEPGLGRWLEVLEAGTSFGFLALMIAYVPILYQSFSRREHFIVMLDSRAGSNPSAGEMIRRHTEAGAVDSLTTSLREAEKWCAEQLETYLSYPILAYYRSQHDTQSWLTTLTAILDTCSVILASGTEGGPLPNELRFQTQATFAMARHVVVDLAYVLNDPPVEHPLSRLGSDDCDALQGILVRAGWSQDGFRVRLDEYRSLYEPYLVGLARDLHFTLPSWVADPEQSDNWQVTAWEGARHF